MIKYCLLALLALTGCSPKSVDDYHTAESDEQIVRMLNGREYGKAIWEIESQSGKLPDDKNTAFLLGQAYLGQAGFEPLETAAKVSAAQDFSTAEARAMLPACPSAELGPLKDADPLCLLKRVYFNVPDPDSMNLVRARTLFRHAYPDPGTAPEWVNIVIGVIETASVVKRAGAIYLLAKRATDGGDQPTDAQLRFLARQVKLLLEEADQAINRANHAGNKISQMLTGSGGADWFSRVSDGVHWANTLGLANLIDLLKANVLTPNEADKYGPLLDKIRSYLDDQDKRIALIAG
jgi:hypothetical protein